MSESRQVTFRNITKSYGGVHALQGVNLEITPGEVHALCGENGAGKSTLIKILTGSVTPDEGEVEVAGRPLRLGDVRASEEAGIAVMHQESTAFLHLNAEQNVFAGRELRRLGGLLLDRPAMRRETRRLLDELGEHFDQRCPLSELTVAQRQMVGIARAMSKSCCVFVMDEPTASLSARETQVLFRIIRQLRSAGVSILYVSHRMEEIFELSDRVTVLRDGKYVATHATREIGRHQLIQLMVGRELQELVSPPAGGRENGRVLLEVQGLSRAPRFADVSFQVRAGEIVGLSGLVGAGRSEVAETIFGIAPADAGCVMMAGRTLRPASIKAAIEAGVALVPEDRQHLGLVLPMSVAANLSLAVLGSLTRAGMISRRREGELARQSGHALSIKAATPAVATDTLSGGNQQKVMLGKWLAARPRLLILDEPTRGIDVAAKAEVHRLVGRLAQEGVGILLISSDLPELLALSDRILVMRQGRISGQFGRAEATQEKILEKALPQS